MDGVQREDIGDAQIVMKWFSEMDTTEPKAILVYDVNDERLREALDGYKFKLAIWDLDQWLRTRLKYHKLPRSMDIGYSNVRKQIRNVCDNYGIEFDD